MNKLLSVLLFPLGTAMAQAAPPAVVADIAPVHSLVSQVMAGVGTPSLLIRPGASPHDYAMRPSDARALNAAQIVVWVGPELTPQLDTQIDTLAGGAVSVALLDQPGTLRLAVRDAPGFAPHDHDDHVGHDDHDHGAIDPHAWLDPDNARVWLDAIAQALADADPDNADAYRANAADSAARIDALEDDIVTLTDPVRSGSHIVFHDAYQYFEHRFDLPAAGAISLSDASDPSPSRIAALRQRIAADDIRCALSEPQFNAGLVDAVFEGTDARSAVIDPLGSALTPGADLYGDLLRGVARSFADCR
ncbi:zinc ABC transporter substrate-binding protein [Oceaniglobus indicus]|uniref:zinc ABC transporter substrate-binding protein n=1 Tax=Oceaniglobus indicus TaxID=2047749 RepID=UPI000C176B82|nr:zinc ABC transporter substrate-binding protein [Oceaniglobus indicus]